MSGNRSKEERNGDASWQGQKSAFTRERIVLATINSLAEYGYSRTTMARIAKISGLSPGAMQHHFKTKTAIIKATIDHLNLKRIADQYQDMRAVPAGVDRTDHSIDVYWKHLMESNFGAYQELVIAARTDPELAAILQPAYRSFIKMWRADAVEAVPEWHAGPQFELAANVAQYLMEGAAYGMINKQLSETEVKELLNYAKKHLRPRPPDDGDDG